MLLVICHKAKTKILSEVWILTNVFTNAQSYTAFVSRFLHSYTIILQDSLVSYYLTYALYGYRFISLHYIIH